MVNLDGAEIQVCCPRVADAIDRWPLTRCCCLAQIDKPFSNKPKCVVVTTKARKLYYYCDDDEATQSWCDVMALAADRAGRQRKLEDEMRSEGLRGLAEVVARKDELAAANDDLAEELTLVQTELSAAREELAQAHQAQMDLCSKHQAELEGLVERHSTELAALRKERDEAVAAAGATVLLQGRHEEASKALSVALAGRDEHVRRHESLRTEHESLADENAHLIARNSELALQVAQLQAAMEKAADINTCASECGPKPDDSTAAYGAEAGATPDGARDLHEPTIAGAACDDSTDWHSKYLELQHELNAMRLQGSAGLDSLVDSESAVASVVAEHDALTAAHDALKGDHSALLEKYGSLSGDLEALRVKHEELLASVDPSNHESEAAVAALVAERDTVVAERDALKGGHNALAEAHNDVHGDLEALRVKHEELMASVDSSRVDSEAAVASLVAERDALAAERDVLKGDHSALREQHEELSSELDSLQDRVFRMTDESSMAKTQLDECIDVTDDLRAQVAASERLVSSLRQELEVLREEADSCRDELAVVKSAHTQLQQHLDASSAELSASRDDVVVWKQRHDQIAEARLEDSNAATAKLQQLVAEREQAEADAESAAAAFTDLQTLHESMQTAHDREQEAMKEALAAAQSEHDALKGDHSALREQHESVTGDLEALRVKHEELLASVDSSRVDSEAAVASLVAERDALAAEHDALKGDHSALREQHGSVTSDLEALRVKHEDMLLSAGPSPVTPTRIAVDRCVGSAAVPVAADTGDEASGLDTVRVGGAVRRPACAYCVIQQDATRGGARGAGNARMQLLAVARPPSDQPVEVPPEEDGGGTEGAHRPLVVPEGLGLDEVHIDADTHRAALVDGMSVSSSSDDDAAVGLAAGASATTPATRQAPSAVAALRRSILARISTPAPRGTAGASGFVTPVRGASMPGRGPPAAHAAAGGVESPITGASAAGRWLSAAHARSLSSHANEGTAPALSFRRASQHSTERASPASMVAAGKWVEILPDDGSQFSLSRDEDAIEALWGSKKVCAAVLLRVLFNAGILWVVGDGMSCVAGPAAVVHLDARRGRPQLRVHVAKARHGWRYHGPSPPPH